MRNPSQARRRPTSPQKEYEVDFSVKESGRTRQIAGYDTKESIATVTVREKGTTLEEAGGMILEAAMWMAPEIKALEELQAFRLRYAQQVYGPVMTRGRAEHGSGRGDVSDDEGRDGQVPGRGPEAVRHCALRRR